MSGRAVVAIRSSGQKRWNQQGPGRISSRNRCRSGRPGTGAGRGRGPGDRGEAGGGHEEVLDSLAGDLAGVVVSEGVQQMAVVGDLLAVDVLDRGELAGQPGGGRCTRTVSGGHRLASPPVTFDLVAVSGW